MNIIVRLTRALYEHALEDLRRPHAHAYERVGFASTKTANLAGGGLLVLVTEYHPLPDERYIEDRSVGARIDSDAIRGAMQRVLDTGRGAFHIHLHDLPGRTNFSGPDREGIPPVVDALRVAGPREAHGMIVFGHQHARAEVWAPGAAAAAVADRVTVVGRPLFIFDKERL
ncbi:MAG: hypothetical protein H0T60_00890 [Acidobacteria bacterium]|nr:hypothetical protein [Acidobacteriota bacterium]